MAANQTDTLQEQIAVLTAKVKQQEFRVADLQRKSRGTTRANRVVAEHQRQLAALREQITAIQDRLAKLGDNASAAQAMAFTDEAKRIDARVDSLWTDLNAQLTELAGRVDHIGTRAAEAHQRLDDHEAHPIHSVDPETTTIELNGSVSKVTRWGIAIVIGVVLALGSFLLPGTVTRVPVLFAIILGIATVFITAGLMEKLTLDLNGRLLWGLYEQPDAQTTTVQLPAQMADEPARTEDDQDAAQQPAPAVQGQDS